MRILFSIIILFQLHILGQVDVTGIVKDNVTGESLPFVSVVLESKSIGTTTDIDGNFRLTVPSIPCALTFSYLGYSTVIKDIGVNQLHVNILMGQEAIEIKELIVRSKRKRKKDTLALRILKQVIDHKEDNKPQFYDSYQYEQYSKLQVELYDVQESISNSFLFESFPIVKQNIDTSKNGISFLPILMKETVKRIYSQRQPPIEDEITIADQLSGIPDESLSQIVDLRSSSYNLYDNNIQVSDKWILGPFAPSSRLNYIYWVEDSLQMLGEWYYRLGYAPRSREDLGFLGTALIHKETWALKNVDLSFGNSANVNFINDFYVRQEFELIDPVENLWHISNEVAHMAANLGKKKEKTSIRAKRTVNYKYVTLNQPKQDDFFNVEQHGFQSENNNEEIWDDLRHNPLSETEEKIYATVDSVKNTKQYKRISFLSYFLSTGYIKVNRFDIGRAYKFLSFNEIEGTRFRFGGRTRKQFSDKVRFTGHVAYGTEDKLLKYGLLSQYYLQNKDNKWHWIGLDVEHDYTRMFSDEISLLSYDNFFNSILREDTIDDLMRLKKIGLIHEKVWMPGILTRTSVRHNTFYSVTGTFDFSAIENGQFREADSFQNPEFEIMFRYSPNEIIYQNQFRRSLLPSKNPVFELTYTTGIPLLFDESFNFHKLNFKVKQSIPSLMGRSTYTLSMGKIFNQVPYPLLIFFPGNETFLLAERRYNLMNDFEYASDQYVSLWLNHSFEGFVLNKVPLVKKLKLRSLVHAKLMYGEISPQNKNEEGPLLFPQQKSGELLLQSPDGIYAEVGVGIENIFKIIRIDYVQRLTDLDKPEVTKWRIQVGIKPKF